MQLTPRAHRLSTTAKFSSTATITHIRDAGPCLLRRYTPCCSPCCVRTCRGTSRTGIVVSTKMLQLPSGAAALFGAGLCFGLRVLAIRHDWQVPVAEADRERSSDFDKAGRP